MIVTRKAARAVLRTLALGGLLFGLTQAWAAPWAEVGDAQLRSDIETLAMAGVIDNLTTEWPVPWTRILDRLSVSGALTGQPSWVVDAAERIRRQAAGQMAQDTSSFSAYFDATNAPEVVRGFDALGRENVQTQGTLSWNGESTFIQLSAGLQSHDHFDIADRAAGWHVHRQADLRRGRVRGLHDALVGTGLDLGTVPVEQRATRFRRSAFRASIPVRSRRKWLSWMGPWQAEFFVGMLDGDMIPTHTLIDGLRFNINPAAGTGYRPGTHGRGMWPRPSLQSRSTIST